MKLTNKFNLPNRVLKMLSIPYQPKKGRYGVTTLCDSPRINTLCLERWDDLVWDYSDFLPTVIGIGVHNISQDANKDDTEVEHKMEVKIDGQTVVGRSDLYIPEEHTIVDTKTKATGFKRFGIDKEIKQLNYYSYLYRLASKQVRKLLLDIWYRDWFLWKTKTEKDYPTIDFEEIEVPLWSFEDQEHSIKSDVQYHIMNPMDCPDEFRWKKETTWAVMKEGQKRAVRLFDTKEEALSYRSHCYEDFTKYSVVERPGECTRCLNYCKARSVCSYALSLKGN